MSSSGGDELRTYHGRPILKEPAWTWEVPWYLFLGGMAGVSSTMAAVAEARGQEATARQARGVALAGAVLGPALLVKDLGRPARFLNMLRVFKPTSAMSVGSWLLAVWSGLAGAAGALDRLGRLGGLRRLLGTGAGVFGVPVATYTGVLIADSAVPAWHEARNDLPVLFAASGAAAAGAAGLLAGGPSPPAARLAVGGGTAALVSWKVMRRRLGDVGSAYDHHDPRRWEKAGTMTMTAGTLLTAVGALGATRRSRGLGGGAWTVISRLGALLILAGSVSERWAVFRAGFVSAADAGALVRQQRAAHPGKTSGTPGNRPG